MLCACVLMLPACKKGKTGPAGTANVQFSPWIPSNPWVRSTTSIDPGKQTYYFDIDAPKVTQAILDSGLVVVYAKWVSDPDGAGIVKQLPNIYYNVGGAATQYRFQTGLFLGKIRVICDVVPSGFPANNNSIRYLVIPGGVPTGRRAGPDFDNYEEVCRFYDLQP